MEIKDTTEKKRLQEYIATIQNIIHLGIPNEYVIADTVQPKQNPLKSIIPNTIGIPTIVVPASHIIIANNVLFFTDCVTKLALSIFSIDLNF